MRHIRLLFLLGTASGHIKQKGDNPPAYAGKKSGLWNGLCGDIENHRLLADDFFKKLLTKMGNYFIIQIVLIFAGMAELADAHGSGPCESNFMQVQVR